MNQCWPDSMTHICSTWGRWFNCLIGFPGSSQNIPLTIHLFLYQSILPQKLVKMWWSQCSVVNPCCCRYSSGHNLCQPFSYKCSAVVDTIGFITAGLSADLYYFHIIHLCLMRHNIELISIFWCRFFVTIYTMFTKVFNFTLRGHSAE